MNLYDPFQVAATGSPPARHDSDQATCVMLLPVAEDAPRGTKPEVCGAPAVFKVRLGDAVARAEVDACARCKARHDSEAASLRHRGRRGGGPRKAAS